MTLTGNPGRLAISNADPGVEQQAGRLKRQYTIAVGLVVCLIICTQLLITSALRIQQQEAHVLALAGVEQRLGEQLVEAALEALSPALSDKPSSKARLLGLCDEWTLSREELGTVLGVTTQTSELAQIRLAAKNLGKPSSAGEEASLPALANAVVAGQSALWAERTRLLGEAQERSGLVRRGLKQTGVMISLVTLLVVAAQAWCLFGKALWLVRVERGQVDRITQQSELILNSAGEAIWVVDEVGRTTFVNPAAAATAGYAVAELLGRSQHEVLNHSNKDGAPFQADSCPICRAHREGIEHRASDDLFWKKDKTSFPVEYHSVPIREDGRLVGAVLTFKNISEHRMLQSKLVQAQKLESIGQLAAGIAHEINTPIQFVGDNTRFLKDAFASMQELLEACQRVLTAAEQGEIDRELVSEARAVAAAADVDYLCEEVPKSIDQSLEGIERVAKIVRAMKEFSHPDGETKSAIDINKAIESTVTVARNEWKYVADLKLDLDAELPLVTCLGGELNQVILNLVVNAAHAIADVQRDGRTGKGAIGVSTRCEGDQAVIRISDTGAGIPEAIRSRIFDPFFTTKPVGKGTGQGLAIAYSVVVEKHGGTIGFESEVGVGTTFILRLPINGEVHAPVEAPAESSTCAVSNA